MRTKDQILNTLSRLDINVIECFERMLRPCAVRVSDKIRFTQDDHADLDTFFLITSVNKDLSVDLISISDQVLKNVPISEIVF